VAQMAVENRAWGEPRKQNIAQRRARGLSAAVPRTMEETERSAGDRRIRVSPPGGTAGTPPKLCRRLPIEGTGH
jgi:hypothetical protein